MDLIKLVFFFLVVVQGSLHLSRTINRCNCICHLSMLTSFVIYFYLSPLALKLMCFFFSQLKEIQELLSESSLVGNNYRQPGFGFNFIRFSRCSRGVKKLRSEAKKKTSIVLISS